MSNIYQVLSEDDLDEIIEQNSQVIIVLMIGSKTCRPCSNIKPKFRDLATQNSDCFFVYVDIHNFKPSDANKYKVSAYPTFVYIYNMRKVGGFEGSDEKELFNSLKYLKIQLEQTRRELLEEQHQQKLRQIEEDYKKQLELQQQQLQNPIKMPTELSTPREVPSELKAKKVDILRKLFELTRKGYVLSKKYSMASDYDDMVFEYNMLTNPDFELEPEYTNIEPTVCDGDVCRVENGEQEMSKEQLMQQVLMVGAQQRQLQMQHAMALDQVQKLEKLKKQAEDEDEDESESERDSDSEMDSDTD